MAGLRLAPFYLDRHVFHRKFAVHVGVGGYGDPRGKHRDIRLHGVRVDHVELSFCVCRSINGLKEVNGTEALKHEPLEKSNMHVER